MERIFILELNYYEYLKSNYPEYLSHYTKRKAAIDFVVDEFNVNDEEEYLTQIIKKDSVVETFLQNYINTRYNGSRLLLFNKIEIETINSCNNDCSFCPVNTKSDKRKHTIMTDELFKKIILELSDLNYSGAIGIFSNNEPLLDPSIIERVQFAKTNVKNSFLYLYTNGLLLSEEKLVLLLKYTDFLHINNYNYTKELLKPHKKIRNFLINNHIDHSKVEIHLRNKKEYLSSRAGTSPNRSRIEKLNSKCILPFSQMVIRPSGKISLCCNDACGNYTLGDASSQSLLDIWNGNEFNSLRNNMFNGRNVHPACKKCDMVFMPLAFE